MRNTGPYSNLPFLGKASGLSVILKTGLTHMTDFASLNWKVLDVLEFYTLGNPSARRARTGWQGLAGFRRAQQNPFELS